jgi:hypothetical protein
LAEFIPAVNSSAPGGVRFHLVLCFPHSFVDRRLFREPRTRPLQLKTWLLNLSTVSCYHQPRSLEVSTLGTPVICRLVRKTFPLPHRGPAKLSGLSAYGATNLSFAT